MRDTAIHVENLSKRYRIGGPQAQYKTIRETVTDLVIAPVRRFRSLGQPASAEETIWALKDVSFDVTRGEVVGIIGRNGAGKTTLLKILSRITFPTVGRAEIHGRVGSLLEVGTGFHPELTGRENIYLNGAILGMKRTEIDSKFDEIVEFAEMERFLDTPVKRYSSGMYVRLAFAVAAHLEPEILLVDEVLAVGDAAFQKKCLGKMDGVAKEGRTVLFVSHNMGAILQLCARAIVLAGGNCVVDSDASIAVSRYLSEMQSPANQVTFDIEPDKNVQITSMSVVSPDGRVIGAHPHTDPLCVLLEYRVAKWPIGSYVCLDVFNERDIRLLWSSDVTLVDDTLVERPPGRYQCRITIPGMVLSPGRYSFTGAIYAPGRVKAFDAREKAVSIEITDGGSFLSTFGIRPHAATMIPLSWETTQFDSKL
jgi:lipopolysaccharide transport system ATP-binding protein